MTDDWDLPLVTSLQYTLFLPLCLPPLSNFLTQYFSPSPVLTSSPPPFFYLSIFSLSPSYFFL